MLSAIKDALAKIESKHEIDPVLVDTAVVLSGYTLIRLITVRRRIFYFENWTKNR
jgi:hypothetical protein